MKFRAAAVSLALASLTVTAFAAEANPFQIVGPAGQKVGHAFYSIDKTKDGYKVKAHFEYSIPNSGNDNSLNSDKSGSAPTEAQYTYNYKVDQNGDFNSGYTQDTATQIMMSFQPNKKRDNMTIGEMQAGENIGSHPMGTPLPHYLVAPDYDPSSIQMLLLTALAHPHPDAKYSLMVPGRARPSRNSGTSAGDSFVYVSLGPLPGAKGTLDGKPIDLKHFQLNYYKGKADLYTDADGKLMEADMDPLRVKFIRDGFTLAAQ